MPEGSEQSHLSALSSQSVAEAAGGTHREAMERSPRV